MEDSKGCEDNINFCQPYAAFHSSAVTIWPQAAPCSCSPVAYGPDFSKWAHRNQPIILLCPIQLSTSNLGKTEDGQQSLPPFHIPFMSLLLSNSLNGNLISQEEAKAFESEERIICFWVRTSPFGQALCYRSCHAWTAALQRQCSWQCLLSLFLLVSGKLPWWIINICTVLWRWNTKC